MKLLKFLSILLMAAPLLALANGTYTPGTVKILVSDGGAFMSLSAAYNVRYNPAVSRGSVGVTVNPGHDFYINAYDSKTGVFFTCFDDPAVDENYYEFESVMSALTSGGNGSSLVTSEFNGICQSPFITSASAYLD